MLCFVGRFFNFKAVDDVSSAAFIFIIFRREPMGILEITNLTHSFGDKILYKNATLELFKGEHMGIIDQIQAKI